MSQALRKRREAPAAIAACVGCGARMTGEYCAACGQRAWRGRFTMRSLVTHLIADALDINRGVPHTIRELSTRPGRMIREYVAGRTAPYTNPVKYFLIVGAVTTFIFVRAGVLANMADGISSGFRDGGLPGVHPAAAAIIDFATSYFTLLMAAALPGAALASYSVFRRAGHNYAEHLIFNTYVGAQQCIILVLLLGLSFIPGLATYSQTASFAIASAFYVWAAVGFFGGARVPAILRAVFATMLNFAVVLVVITLVALTAILVARTPG